MECTYEIEFSFQQKVLISVSDDGHGGHDGDDNDGHVGHDCDHNDSHGGHDGDDNGRDDDDDDDNISQGGELQDAERKFAESYKVIFSF